MSVLPDRPARGVARTILIVVAFALGVAAVLLVVIGDTRKQVTIGALLGAWSALIGGFTLIGPRRTAHEPLSPGRESLSPGRELELRHSHELELEREAAGRRAYELQLEVMLRRELEKVLREELSALRTEVAGLRNDLVEKVNGQLRLERIETTRVIGSDIEALQHEVRRLAGTRELSEPAARAALGPGTTEPFGSIVEVQPAVALSHPAAAWAPLSVLAAEPHLAARARFAMDVSPAPMPPPVPPLPPPPPVPPPPPPPPVPPPAPPVPVPPPVPAPPVPPLGVTAPPVTPFSAMPPPAVTPRPEGSLRPVTELFAGMPRLDSFAMEAAQPPEPLQPIKLAEPIGPAEPISPAEPMQPIERAILMARSSPPSVDPPPTASGYVGRRRSGEPGFGDAGGADTQHADAEQASTPLFRAPREGGGRRRRAEGQTDDVLSRLIGQ